MNRCREGGKEKGSQDDEAGTAFDEKSASERCDVKSAPKDTHWAPHWHCAQQIQYFLTGQKFEFGIGLNQNSLSLYLR